jgi:hypothetical protein
VAIEFKNPLAEKAAFIATFDNPCFSMGAKMPDTLEPGKATQLQVKYDENPDHPTTGRMIVSCKDLASWVYYLAKE